jgi:hypothetical protein
MRGSGDPGLGAKSASLTVPGFGSVGTRNKKPLQSDVGRLCEAIFNQLPTLRFPLPPPPTFSFSSPPLLLLVSVLCLQEDTFSGICLLGLTARIASSLHPSLERALFQLLPPCGPYQLEQREGNGTFVLCFSKRLPSW